MSSWSTIVKKNKNKNTNTKSGKPDIKKKEDNLINKLETNMSNQEINLLFEETNGEILEKYIYEVTNIFKKDHTILDNVFAADIENFFYKYIDKLNSIEIKEPEINQDLIDDEDYDLY